MNSRSIRLSLDVSPELNKMLDEMSTKIPLTKSQLLRNSILLMSVLIDEKERGNQVSITHGNNEILKEIIAF